MVVVKIDSEGTMGRVSDEDGSPVLYTAGPVVFDSKAKKKYTEEQVEIMAACAKMWAEIEAQND